MVFNVCLGLAFAVCGRDRIRADGPFAPPAFPVVMIFVGVIVVPFTLYMYAAHPAWTWMYFVDPARVPALAMIPLVVLHGGMVVAGWYVGARLVRAKKTRPALYAAGGGALLVLIMVLPFWERLGYYGTYIEYMDDRAIPLMSVKLGYVLIAAVLGAGVAAALVALELMRDSRRVRTR